METPERLVNKGQRLGLGLEEEWVIVAADFAVECCQSFWCEVCGTVVVKGRLDSSQFNLAFIDRGLLTIICAIPRHSCSNSGAGLLSGLIRVPQWLAAEDMAGLGLALFEGGHAEGGGGEL